MNTLIVGYGEIGKGLGDNLAVGHKIFVHDPAKGCDFAKSSIPIDMLHICIPGNSRTFVQDVVKLIEQFNPRIATIINSTVVPGTTAKVQKLAGKPVAHVPIRGKHPNMASHIKEYILHIGSDIAPIAIEVSRYFKQAGLRTIKHSSSRETELGKILELFRYGWEVYLATYQKQICDLYEVDYETTVKSFINTYNDGLDKVGYSDYKQPTIVPMSGNRLGGHCVIENCYELLKALPDNNVLTNLLHKLIMFGQGDRDLL